ncbi:unnamed protein product [Pichia kudriavzevii]
MLVLILLNFMLHICTLWNNSSIQPPIRELINVAVQLKNKARSVLKIIDSFIQAIGAFKLALRQSPYATSEGAKDRSAEINPIVTTGYMLSKMERRARQGKRLAYLSMAEPRVDGDKNADVVGTKTYFSWLTLIWNGTITKAGECFSGNRHETLQKIVNGDDRTLIGISRYFTSNPDLVNRLKNSCPVTPCDRSTFFTNDNKRHLNFSKFGDGEDHSGDYVQPTALV